MYNLEMDKNTFVTSLIKMRTEGVGIADYWLYDSNPLLKKVSTFMNRPIFTSGQLPVSYRVLNHWCNAGLLPEGVISDGTWRKLTFVERAWIGVVAHLREFGVPLESIARARKDVLVFDTKCKGYVMFEYYLSRAVTSKDDPYFIMLADGTADVGNSDEIEINKLGSGPTDALLISLKSVLKTLGENAYVTDKPLVSLSEEEMSILEVLRTGTDDELVVKLKDGKVSETQVSKSQHGKLKIADVLTDLKKSKAYADVTIKFQDGIPEMVKVLKKKRSKSKPSEYLGL